MGSTCNPLALAGQKITEPDSVQRLAAARGLFSELAIGCFIGSHLI
jgi:hypothetical protein